MSCLPPAVAKVLQELCERLGTIRESHGVCCPIGHLFKEEHRSKTLLWASMYHGGGVPRSMAGAIKAIIDRKN